MVWLVVGLGNPGDEYSSTRHNIGQMVVDALAVRHNARWTTHKSRTSVAAFKIGVGADAASVIIAKSHGYMNESGGPVSIGLVKVSQRYGSQRFWTRHVQ